MPTKRIEYIDALRGFTMILVVFSHVLLFTFDYNSSFINGLFILFRMPLFFWVSGFIAYKASTQWNRQTWWQMSKKKLMIQLIPTFTFGLIYTYAYSHADFQTFGMHNGKLGYWFTLALLEIFIIVYTTNLCLYNSNQETHRKRMFVALILLSGGLFLTKIALNIHPALNEIGNILSLHRSFNYFQYFAFGYICSMYKEEFNKTLESKYFTAIITFLFATLFYTNSTYISSHVSNGMDMWRMCDIIAEMIAGYLGLLIVYNTYKTYEHALSSEKKMGRALQFIGKRTLDIYLLHYFFLPYIPQVGSMLQKVHNATLELPIGVLQSLTIIGICLIVRSILRTSPILAKYSFGVHKR
jgi:fucose 4-O-acetylase-like acetyltransferase